MEEARPVFPDGSLAVEPRQGRRQKPLPRLTGTQTEVLRLYCDLQPGKPFAKHSYSHVRTMLRRRLPLATLGKAIGGLVRAKMLIERRDADTGKRSHSMTRLGLRMLRAERDPFVNMPLDESPFTL